MTKIALISGITGQDGSYLSELLTEKGYIVYGLVRRITPERKIRCGELISCDITNYASVYSAFQKIQPDEIYHLAAQSFVKDSFEDPFTTLSTNIMGTLNMLEAMRHVCPKSKFYFAGSSEQFGEVKESPQYENTPFHARSPYACSKICGFELCRNYREAYDLFICCGILFNHESERRGGEFVTKKIINELKAIKEGKTKEIRLGNIRSERDWGFARDYVEAMYLMLQQERADDYVIATGETHTIEEFVKEAADVMGIKEYRILTDPKFFRPSDVITLKGNSDKAYKLLGWKSKTSFKELVRRMCEC